MYLSALILAVAVSAVAGQYDGPLPPRPVVPGALPIGRNRGPLPVALPPRRIGGRGRAPAPPGVQLPAIRSRPPPQLPPRPVVEPEEDLTPTTIPPPTYQPTTFQPPIFRASLSPADLPVPSRQQFPSEASQEETATYRPRTSIEEDISRQEIPAARPSPIDENFSKVRTSQEDQGFTRGRPASSQEATYPRPSRPTIQDAQPTFQRARPSSQEQSYSRPRIQQAQEEQNLVRGRTEAKPSYNRASSQARPKPIPQEQVQQAAPGPRRGKPTSQVIKKYREDNPDGSITWGFENDDGTFKEETIGTDCVTYGKYGYYDPDGVRREYTYSSGIPCEKRDQDSIVGATNEGYIDYTNNKYVLPNGQEVALDNMGKNKARRPVYRN
ncbi:putative uncharacterized protein DDB_G0290521 [Halyomorpha halys]|uniref:putative uncharacterized protein DDB_G0290521 n=1 Tax=Halyomorpha halys TaxID=286706 RepID=UPI0006D525F4|nr:uncharacterized protein LOC106680937 [Halyomorpha halys]